MSETKAVEKIPRPPKMRSLQMGRLPGLMAAALGFATFNTWVYYYFVFDARRKAYRDFYASYDADKAYAEMKKTGIFQSTAIIEGESEEEWKECKNNMWWDTTKLQFEKKSESFYLLVNL